MTTEYLLTFSGCAGRPATSSGWNPETGTGLRFFDAGLALAFFFILALCLPGGAATGGSISGVVSDASGAAMPDVRISVRNPATGVMQSTVTNDAGFYAFPAVLSGAYELRAERVNFQPFVQAGLAVTTAASLKLDVQLAVESHTEAITVTEARPRSKPATRRSER